MSGGGRRNGGGWQGGDPINCKDLNFETNLASPVESVVVQLHEGAELDVALTAGEPQRVIVRFNGLEAGGIVGSLPDLIRCLQLGNKYTATVQEIDDGAIRVKVRLK